jgi:hypothetical protein
MRRWLLTLGLGGCLGLVAGLILEVRPGSARVVREPFFGYDVAYGSEPVSKTLIEAKHGGADTIRYDLHWSQVQPTPRHHYYFGSDDHIYHQVVRRGIRPLIIISAAPCWAHPSVRCHNHYNTVRPDRRYLGRWRKFVTAVARRYPRARGFEIWNEPNLKGFWGRKPSPSGYARVLRAAYRGVERAHSDVPVVFGGVAPTAGWLRFVRRAYRHGAARYSDILATHLYAFVAPVVESVLSEAKQIDAVRFRYDPSAPLWVTETGVSTATGRIWQPTVRRRQQARSLVGIYRGLGRLGIGMVNVFRLRDPTAGLYPPRTWQTGLGVEHRDGAPKPAYCALARTRGASPSRCRR